MEQLGLNHVFFNKDLVIVNGSKEFFIFFDRPENVFMRIDELVLPEEKDQFINFIQDSTVPDDFRIFHFKTNTKKYNPYVITIDKSEEPFCLNLLDFKESLKLYKNTAIQNRLYVSAFSITDEYTFSYRASNGIFKIYNHSNGHKMKLLVDNIADLKNNAVRNALVLGKNIQLFEEFINKLKNLEDNISVEMESSIRSNGMVFENVVFKGKLHEEKNDTLIVGRILPSETLDRAEKTNSLIKELKFDSLTKVYNKKAITEYAIKRIGVNKDDFIALIIVDLDHFKPVNDAYGHMAGDKVLEKTGELLRNIAGENNAVGRYGGDEFMVIMDGMTDELILRGVLHAILVQIRTAFENCFDDIKVTASVGCAVHRKDALTYEELFKKADFCLYRAKDKGRNRYVFFRDDLHGELYKKASESKDKGIKYDDREVKELEYMSEFMLELGANPTQAMRIILEHMVETYNLDDISIYYGDEMKRVYSLGSENETQSEAKYVFSEGFKNALAGKKYVRIDFPEDLKDEYGDFKSEMEKREIKSTIQCVLYSGSDIKGLVTFDRTKAPARWAEYEKNCSLMFASSLNLLPDFAGLANINTKK